MSKSVRVEFLFGRRVRDARNKVVGRIECIFAKWDGQDCVVERYDLGPGAMLERFGVSAASLVGWPAAEPLRVPWDQLDLSDPERPCLRCTLEELKKMTR